MTPSPRRHLPLLLGLAASLLALGLQHLGVLTEVENVATDLMMRLRGPRPVDSRIAIVAIDETSVDAYGQWPWPRTVIAELIDRLSAAGAGAIALDIVFSEPSRSDERVDLRPEDEALATAIERAGNVILGFFFRAKRTGAAPPGADPANVAGAAIGLVFNDPECGFSVPWRAALEPNLDRLAAVAAGQGFFSNERRATGKMRRYDLVIAHGAKSCPGAADCPAARACGEHLYFPALALAAVARFTDLGLSIAGEGRAPELALGEGAIATDQGGSLLVNYHGPRGAYPIFPVVDVLTGKVSPEALRGKLLFVGATETGIGDFQVTPFGEVAGVEIHAHAADNLLHDDGLRQGLVEDALSLLALLALGPLVALSVSSARRYLVGSLAAIAAVLAWLPVAYAAFRAGHHLQVVAPALAGVVALVATLRYQIAYVDRDKRRIRSVFERYVSKSIVEEVLSDPERVKLGGEKRVLTVLFSDIRGFTDLSERLDPQQVTRLLNQYFTPMTRLVIAHGGTLDKYMGDALMAFFGAPGTQPDHATRACRAALAMRAELVHLNAAWKRSGELRDGEELGVGIGLATGEASVGNMGSEEIFDYTVIGDTVNLGSRIEGLNKQYGTSILISEATAAAVGKGFLLREVDRVRVKGKQVPVTLYEVVAEEPAPAEVAAEVGRFHRALALYRERDFTTATEIFASLLPTEPHGPAALYLERSRHYAISPPPDDWDGVSTFRVK